MELAKTPIEVEALKRVIANYPNSADKQIVLDCFQYGFRGISAIWSCTPSLIIKIKAFSLGPTLFSLRLYHFIHIYQPKFLLNLPRLPFNCNKLVSAYQHDRIGRKACKRAKFRKF
jgi:hypothetical protein